LKAKAVRHEFPGLCDFIEMHEPALEALLAEDSNLAGSRWHICREGGLSAVLASGVFILHCERHPKALFFELLYRKTVRLPHDGALRDLQAKFFLPLQQLSRVGCRRWWLETDALRLIASSLEAAHFAIVDGLLTEAEVSSLHRTADWFFRAQKMRPGVEEQRGGYGGYWGDGNEGDIQNREGLTCKWTVEGDYRSWVSDDDNRAQEVRPLTSAVDALVEALRDNGGTGNIGLSPIVAQRMRTITGRESTMIACYPGRTRGRYLRHCDTGRGAVLTAIFYLNSCWSPNDGGELRLYESGFHNTQVKLDVQPLANRLLLFWATEEHDP